MPTIRIVMPNGTTRAFREGTPKSVIEAAKRDMIASMRESPADHENYRASRRVTLTGWDPDDTGESESAGSAQSPETTAPETFDGDEPWNADYEDPLPDPAPVTAEQLKQIMPTAREQDIQQALPALNASMKNMNVNQRAAYLSQIAVESGFRPTSEGSYYSSLANLQNAFGKKRFPDEQSAEPYLFGKDIAGLKNIAYPDGDWGRGYIQVTTKPNYEATGYANNPDALLTPEGAADASRKWWDLNKLNDQTVVPLDRAGFDAVTHAVNHKGLQAGNRWDAYQRGLNVFGVPPQ